jgi:dinuclear metal center YbgI/SA1388 family protein
MMETQRLIDYLDDLLNIRGIEDDSLNGLQVANSGTLHKVALAVDASAASIKKAKEIGAQLLFVHHGLFWGRPLPLTGYMYQRIQLLIKSDIALYAAHLPLDFHPDLGNNTQLCKLMGWPIVGDFGEYRGSTIGKEVRLEKPVLFSEVVDQFRRNLKCEPIIWDFGTEKVMRLGCVSGGALTMLDQAIRAKLDVYVTGEPKHSFYWIAKEASINVIFGGHYTTETFGVQAVGEVIQKEFGLETVFIDLPTGF